MPDGGSKILRCGVALLIASASSCGNGDRSATAFRSALEVLSSLADAPGTADSTHLRKPSCPTIQLQRIVRCRRGGLRTEASLPPGKLPLLSRPVCGITQIQPPCAACYDDGIRTVLCRRLWGWSRDPIGSSCGRSCSQAMKPRRTTARTQSLVPGLARLLPSCAALNTHERPIGPPPGQLVPALVYPVDGCGSRAWFGPAWRRTTVQRLSFSTSGSDGALFKTS